MASYGNPSQNNIRDVEMVMLAQNAINAARSAGLFKTTKTPTIQNRMPKSEFRTMN